MAERFSDAGDIIFKGKLFIDVRAYGATGDGATDDTAAIQAAITAAPTGGMIFFPQGEYLISDTLTIDHELRLIGVGYKSSQLYMDGDKTLIHLDADTYGPTIVRFGEIAGMRLASNATSPGTALIHVDNAGGWHIHDLMVWGAYYCILVEGSLYTICQNVKFDNTGQYTFGSPSKSEWMLYITTGGTIPPNAHVYRDVRCQGNYSRIENGIYYAGGINGMSTFHNCNVEGVAGKGMYFAGGGFVLDGGHCEANGIDFVTGSGYKWTASGSGTNEYYCEASGGGDPSLSRPYTVKINENRHLEGTLGSLAANQWGYGDNDSLGYATLYVRLSDGSDPDTKSSTYIKSIPNHSLEIRSIAGYVRDIYCDDIVALTGSARNIQIDSSLIGKIYAEGGVRDCRVSNSRVGTLDSKEGAGVSFYNMSNPNSAAAGFRAAYNAPNRAGGSLCEGSFDYWPASGLPSGWIAYGTGATQAREATIVHSGDASCHVTLNGSGAGGISYRLNPDMITPYKQNMNSSSYRWVASGSGTNEYYCEPPGANLNPELSEPEVVLLNGSRATEGTLGSLSAGEWGYGDNDSLGYSTLYVRTSGGTDPDSEASGYVQAVFNRVKVSASCWWYKPASSGAEPHGHIIYRSSPSGTIQTTDNAGTIYIKNETWTRVTWTYWLKPAYGGYDFLFGHYSGGGNSYEFYIDDVEIFIGGEVTAFADNSRSGDFSAAEAFTVISRTDATRGTASQMPTGTIIFNTDDGQLNISDGTNWTLPDGTIT